MEYLSEREYAYISNKYHDTEKPFDSFQRFIRNDAIFDPSTGMDGDEIHAEILRRDKAIAHLPHPIRKAEAFAFVLANTRIACDPRDPFPAIHMIDRPIDSILYTQWRDEVFHDLVPELKSIRETYNRHHVATFWVDVEHCVPYWDVIFALGFSGILEESERCRLAHPSPTPETEAFYEGIRITYEAVLTFLRRLEERAETDGSHRMAQALRNLQKYPPSGFYEALLMNYVYFMLLEHVHGMQARSLSNFDRVFYPFYRKDLADGVPQESLCADLAAYLLQFSSIGNYWGQPVYLGGCKADGSTEINELSYVFLDVYDKMGLYNPKIQIKIADSTPKDFKLKALDMIRRGRNSIVFIGDATVRKALTNMGISAEKARTCDIKGCYEYAIRGSIDTAPNYTNLLKPLEFALHEGKDGVTGNRIGLPCPKAEEYPDFDAFFAEYKRQLGHIVDTVCATINVYEDYLDYMHPQSLLSATFPSCLRSGRDALAGGAEENFTDILFGGMADIADSLTNIKKYVFERNMLRLAELRDILDADFEGHEELRRMLLSDRDKYGNNKDLPDQIAREIVDFLCEKINGKPNAKRRGGQWVVGFHVARMTYNWANFTASSPNGRRKGEEMAKNLSASMGMNREGATAAILSITKIDATKFASDACLDLGLLPSAVQGEDGLEAMHALLVTFIKRGGHAMHINVFDAQALREAQAHPEKYADLQIRVCGWNVLFNNIKKEEQDGFIRQAENLIG